MSLNNKLKKELDMAISTCYDFLFEKTKDDTPTKIPLFEILKNINNGNPSYIHHYPYHMILKLTSNCNLRCKHCFFSGDTEAFNSDNDLTQDEMLSQIKYFVEEVNILSCSITGGEIFTSPYLFKLLKYLKSQNIIIELLTNATLITEEMAEQLSSVLNKKTDCIHVSLEGTTKEMNDSIRGEGVFDKATRNIKYLTEKGLNVRLSFTLNSKNAHQLEDLHDLCKRLKISQLDIGRFQVFDSSQKYLEPNLDDIFINVAKLVNKFKKDKAIKFKTRCIKTFDFLNYETGKSLLDKKLNEESFDIPQNLYCQPRHEIFSLYPNGDISLCYNCEIENLIIGNLREKSFDKIWAERYTKPIFKERKIENIICKDCKYVPFCNGGCPLNAYQKYKTINAPDSYCKYSEKLMEKSKVKR